jgi:hypothetical protein
MERMGVAVSDGLPPVGRAHDELDLTIPCLVGADTAIGPPLDTFLSSRAAVRADVFGEFFSRVAAALAGA